MAAAAAAGDHGATSLQSSPGRHQGHRDPFQQLENGSQLTYLLLLPLEEGITATGFRGHRYIPGLGWLRGAAAVQDMGSGGSTDLREAGEKTKPETAPQLLACLPALRFRDTGWRVD